MSLQSRDTNQRAGPLAGLGPLLREFGVSPGELSDGVGIEVDLLKPDTRVNFEAAKLLLERSALRTGCPHIGLLLGSRYGWRHHGPIQRLGRLAPTLRQALLDFVTFQGAYSSAAVAYLSRWGSDYGLGFGVHDRASEASRIVYDLSAAVGCNFVRDLTGGAVEPCEVLLCRSPPADPGPYRRILRAPVHFNQSQTLVAIPSSRIDWPLPNFDPAVRERALHEMAESGLLPRTMASRVRRLVRPQLLENDPTLVGAARALGLHPRTLRRRLAQEGETFEALRDDVRFVLARELLDLTEMTIGDVSDAVAFATHAAFARAFARWSGMTPTQWRRRGRARHDEGGAGPAAAHRAPAPP